jgi:hypothetical protein
MKWAKMLISFFQSPALPTVLSCQVKMGGGYRGAIKRIDNQFRRSLGTDNRRLPEGRPLEQRVPAENVAPHVETSD